MTTPWKLRRVGTYFVANERYVLNQWREQTRAGACKLVDAASFRLLGKRGKNAYYADAKRVYADLELSSLTVLERASPNDDLEVLSPKGHIVRCGARFYVSGQLVDYDPRHAKSLGGDYSRAKDAVYWAEVHRVPGAGTDFRVPSPKLAPGLGLDSKAVWFRGKAVAGADPKSFEVLPGNRENSDGIVFAKDARRGYAMSEYGPLIPFAAKHLERLRVVDDDEEDPTASDGAFRYFTMGYDSKRIAKETETSITEAQNAPPPEVDYLFYGDSPAAEPCFRSLFWFEGRLTTPALRKMSLEVVRWFLDHEAERLGRVAVRAQGASLRGNVESQRGKLERWLKAPRGGRGASLFIEAARGVQGVPWLHLTCTDTVVMLEVCLPFGSPDLVQSANTLAALCTRTGVLCGVQGMGFLLPPTWDSVSSMLPGATRQYPCAIEMQLDDAADGVLKRGSIMFWQRPDLEPGIADIGWRTVVGKAFWPRFKVPARLAGVEVAKSAAATTFTAGPAPWWGDRKKPELLAPYRAVAKVLEPVLMPLEVAASSYFGGRGVDDKHHVAKLKAYRRRFG